jgi:hypothetical protein
MKIVRNNTYPTTQVDTANARLPQRNPPRRHIDTGESFALTKGFTPVMLTSGEVSLNTGGGIAVPDHGLLQPVERSPMLVDEIHFNVRTANSALNVDPRWLLRVKISLGRLQITNNFVPLAALEYEYLTNTLYGGAALTGTDFVGKTFTGSRWKPPVPIYVPSGSMLHTQYQTSAFPYITSTTTTTCVIDTTYIGRLLPVDYPVPRTIKVPYVTAITTSDVPVGNAAAPLLQSRDLQLGNPFDTTLYAQRFVMRQYEVQGYGGNNVFAELYDGGSPVITLRGTFNNVDITIANLVNHYIAFDAGFQSTPIIGGIATPGFGTVGHHALNLYNLEMQPKDRFDLTIDARAVSATPLTASTAGLTGWRNENI